MKELLGDDGAKGTVGAELKAVGTAINDMKTIINTAANNAAASNLDTSAKFGDLKTAVEKANKAIDEKLESGDLTQLDTSNLKALKSSINDIKSQIETTFENLNLQVGVSNTAVAPEKAKELQEAFKAVEKSNTELGEKAGGVATSSQKQAETISEMRDQLRGFAANPKAAGLESVNFTGYLETVDAALSNISDQRAKLGASQNETATSSKVAMDGLLGNGGTLEAAMSKITTELNPATADSLAKAIDDAIKGTFPPNADLNFADAYTKFKKTITDSTDIIDEALETNDLTELDTTNLRALRSYLTETLTTVDSAIKDSGLKSDAANDKGTVTKEKLEKIQAGLNSAAELGKTATEKATATYKFSQNQLETK